MGRGTILANLGEGQYSIKLDFGESRLEAQLLLLTGANSDLDTQIAAQQVKVNAAQTALNASNAALAAAIDTYVTGNSSPNLLPQLETAKLDQVAKEETLRRDTVALGKLQSGKANNLRKIDDLNSYRVSLTLNAWCADYTLTASGTVATLEIPNEPETVLVAPTGRAPVDADGELRMRALMTPPQAYYNDAILPGWQKFKPTYRSGVITAIDEDVADVALDEATSSAGGIADIGLANIEFNVNQTSALTNVPIVYQDCNGEAFEVGDAVVVQFMSQNWNAPQIIGFLSNPRPCGYAYCLFEVNARGDLFSGTRNYTLSPTPEEYDFTKFDTSDGIGAQICGWSPLIALDGHPFAQFGEWEFFDSETSTIKGKGVLQINEIRTSNLVIATSDSLAETTNVPIGSQSFFISPIQLDPSFINLPTVNVQSFSSSEDQCGPLSSLTCGTVFYDELIAEGSLSGETVTLSIKGGQRPIGYAYETTSFFDVITRVRAKFGLKYSFGGELPPLTTISTFRTISFELDKFPKLYGKYDPIEIVNVFNLNNKTYIYVTYDKRLLEEIE